MFPPARELILCRCMSADVRDCMAFLHQEEGCTSPAPGSLSSPTSSVDGTCVAPVTARADGAGGGAALGAVVDSSPADLGTLASPPRTGTQSPGSEARAPAMHEHFPRQSTGAPKGHRQSLRQRRYTAVLARQDEAGEMPMPVHLLLAQGRPQQPAEFLAARGGEHSPEPAASCSPPVQEFLDDLGGLADHPAKQHEDCDAQWHGVGDRNFGLSRKPPLYRSLRQQPGEM